jgi:hypothetical protein
MNLFRTRIAAGVSALAVAAAVPACGDNDGKGAAEEIDKGVDKGASEVNKQGTEIDDDVKGQDEKQQKDK